MIRKRLWSVFVADELKHGQEFEKRAGPAMEKSNGYGVGFGGHVGDEMDIEDASIIVGDLGFEIGE